MLSTTRALAEGLLSGRRECLARAITLCESSNVDHQRQAALLLDSLAKQVSQKHSPRDAHRPPTMRLGIAGPPGAGKSTFIEQMGLKFLAMPRHPTVNNRVAVIPVDPSSHISGGSILGDKTRMELLSRSMDAYIRASPTRGVLGGIAEHTADVISLCEYANFNIVIVESVGLGQSEVDIDSAVDMLILIVPPGSGDGLQASKKGIMEAADLVLVNKADGELLSAAKITKADYSGSLQFIRSKHVDWRPEVMLVSAASGYNLDAARDKIWSFYDIMVKNGHLMQKRKTQAQHWAIGQFHRLLMNRLEGEPQWETNLREMYEEVGKGKLHPRAAAEALMESCSFRIDHWKK